MHALLHTVLSFGVGLGFVLATALLVSRERSAADRVLAALFVCASLAFLPALVHLSGEPGRFRILQALSAAAGIALGPLCGLYVRLFVCPELPLRPRHILQFVPVPITFGAALFFNPGALPALVFVAYLLWLWLAIWLRRGGPGRVPEALRPILLWLLAGYLLTTSCVLAGLWFYHELAHFAVTGAVLVMIAHYLALQRHPAMRSMRTERAGIELARADKQRAGKTQLAGVDLAELGRRFEHLMREEQPYLDEDLSLPALAAELELTPHQLSEFLNDTIGKNFYACINEYRVREALRLLAEERERTVLSIAYAVGFNSKSSFHAAFTKVTGTTPQQYRAGLKS